MARRILAPEPEVPIAFRITLLPSRRSFPARADESILEAARRAGIPLPWGCGVGACRTCTARVHAGHVRMPPGTALTEAHLAAHLILPCVARPGSNLVIEAGSQVGLLDPLPWTD